MAKAAELGFKLSRPWGDSATYDVVIELKGRFVRIQVKSTMARDRFMRVNYKQNMYSIHSRRSCGKPYLISDYDYLAMYIIPEDLWYIIPVAVAVRRRSMRVIPGGKRNRYAQYEEAWHLLCQPASPNPRSGITLHAVADILRTEPFCSVGQLLGGAAVHRCDTVAKQRRL